MYRSCPGATEAHSQGGGVYGSPSPGIVGCFAMYPRNLLLNTIIAHSIKQKPITQQGIHPLTLKMYHLEG